MQDVIRLILQKIKDNPNLYPYKSYKKPVDENLLKRKKSMQKY